MDRSQCVWRLHLALSWVLEAWAGVTVRDTGASGAHREYRSALAWWLYVLFEMCRFIQKGAVLTERRLYDTLRWKLEPCRWLVFLAGAQLGTPAAPVAYVL